MSGCGAIGLSLHGDELLKRGDRVIRMVQGFLLGLGGDGEMFERRKRSQLRWTESAHLASRRNKNTTRHGDT